MWAQQGKRARPIALWATGGPPLVDLRSSIFYIFHKNIYKKIRPIHRTFISTQKQHHASSAENSVNPG